MTDENDAIERRADRAAECRAASADGFCLCERCAIAWDPSRDNPACSPITPARLREFAQKILLRLEASHDACLELARIDPRAADPLPALKAVVEARALVRLVERVLDDKELVAMLRKKAAK